MRYDIWAKNTRIHRVVQSLYAALLEEEESGDMVSRFPGGDGYRWNMRIVVKYSAYRMVKAAEK